MCTCIFFLTKLSPAINPVTTLSVDYSCSSSMVAVTWGLVFGANLYRASAVDGTGASLNCTSATGSCHITMLKCGEKYEVHVTAISDDCESRSNTSALFETGGCGCFSVFVTASTWRAWHRYPNPNPLSCVLSLGTPLSLSPIFLPWCHLLFSHHMLLYPSRVIQYQHTVMLFAGYWSHPEGHIWCPAQWKLSNIYTSTHAQMHLLIPKETLLGFNDVPYIFNIYVFRRFDMYLLTGIRA